MARVWKAIGLILFLVIGAYGMMKFIAAHKARAVLADAEAFCTGHEGVGPIETESGMITGVTCADGTVVPLDVDGS